MPNLTVNVIEVKSLGCLTAPKRRPPVRDPMVVIRAGSQRRSTKVQFNAGPDAQFNQSLAFYGIAAATTIWVQCYDGANPSSDALVGEMRASLGDLLKYHTSKGIWLDLTEALASSRAVGRILVFMDTDLPANTSTVEGTPSPLLLVPPAAEAGRKRHSRTPSPSGASNNGGSRRPSVSPSHPSSGAVGTASSRTPASPSSHRPTSPSPQPSPASRPSTSAPSAKVPPGRRSSSTPRPPSTPSSAAAAAAAPGPAPALPHAAPNASQSVPQSSGLLSSTASAEPVSLAHAAPSAAPVPLDRLSSLSRAKHLPSPLDHLDSVTLPSAATTTSVVADTTGTTLTYSLSNLGGSDLTTAHLLSTTPSAQAPALLPMVSPRRHSLAPALFPLAAPSSPAYSPVMLPAVPPIPPMYAQHSGTRVPDTSSPLLGTLAMPEPTLFQYPGQTASVSPSRPPQPGPPTDYPLYHSPPALAGSPNMMPSPTAYAQTPHVPSPFMNPSAVGGSPGGVGRVSPNSTGGDGGGSPLAYPPHSPTPGLFRPDGGFVTMPTDLGSHVTLMGAAGGEAVDGAVPVYRRPLHYPTIPETALSGVASGGGGGELRRHSANAVTVQESLGRLDLNAKPLPYVPHQRPYVNPYVTPQQQ